MSQPVPEPPLSSADDPVFDDLVAEQTDLVQGGRGEEAAALLCSRLSN